MGDGSSLISNKIFTATTNGPLNLWSPKLLALPEYQPPLRFTGGILKLTQTYLLFSSGKVVINGVKDQPDIHQFSLLTGISLYDVRLSHCSGFLKTHKLDLVHLRQNVKASTYEPELHPGLMFKIENVSVIAYHTGSIIFCGCRSEAHALMIRQEILKMINTAMEKSK